MLVNLDYEQFEIQDGVTIDIKPLNVGHYQKVLKYISRLGVVSEDDPEKGVAQFSDPEVAILIETLIPIYSQNLKGIELKEKGATRAATVKDLTKHAAFMPMCFTIMIQIFTISSIKEDESKQIKK